LQLNAKDWRVAELNKLFRATLTSNLVFTRA